MLHHRGRRPENQSVCVMRSLKISSGLEIVGYLFGPQQRNRQGPDIAKAAAEGHVDADAPFIPGFARPGEIIEVAGKRVGRSQRDTARGIAVIYRWNSVPGSSRT